MAHNHGAFTAPVEGLVMDDIDKYLKLIYWLKARYVDEDGYIKINLPGGEPTPYTVLEWAAAEKYLNCYKHSMYGAVKDFIKKAEKHHASPFDRPILEQYNLAKLSLLARLEAQ